MTDSSHNPGRSWKRALSFPDSRSSFLSQNLSSEDPLLSQSSSLFATHQSLHQALHHAGPSSEHAYHADTDEEAQVSPSLVLRRFPRSQPNMSQYKSERMQESRVFRAMSDSSPEPFGGGSADVQIQPRVAKVQMIDGTHRARLRRVSAHKQLRDPSTFEDFVTESMNDGGTADDQADRDIEMRRKSFMKKLVDDRRDSVLTSLAAWARRRSAPKAKRAQAKGKEKEREEPRPRPEPMPKPHSPGAEQYASSRRLPLNFSVPPGASQAISHRHRRSHNGRPAHLHGHYDRVRFQPSPPRRRFTASSDDPLRTEKIRILRRILQHTLPDTRCDSIEDTGAIPLPEEEQEHIEAYQRYYRAVRRTAHVESLHPFRSRASKPRPNQQAQRESVRISTPASESSSLMATLSKRFPELDPAPRRPTPSPVISRKQQASEADVESLVYPRVASPISDLYPDSVSSQPLLANLPDRWVADLACMSSSSASSTKDGVLGSNDQYLEDSMVEDDDLLDPRVDERRGQDFITSPEDDVTGDANYETDEDSGDEVGSFMGVNFNRLDSIGDILYAEPTETERQRPFSLILTSSPISLPPRPMSTLRVAHPSGSTQARGYHGRPRFQRPPIPFQGSPNLARLPSLESLRIDWTNVNPFSDDAVLQRSTSVSIRSGGSGALINRTTSTETQPQEPGTTGESGHHIRRKPVPRGRLGSSTSRFSRFTTATGCTHPVSNTPQPTSLTDTNSTTLVASSEGDRTPRPRVPQGASIQIHPRSYLAVQDEISPISPTSDIPLSISTNLVNSLDSIQADSSMSLGTAQLPYGNTLADRAARTSLLWNHYIAREQADLAHTGIRGPSPIHGTHPDLHEHIRELSSRESLVRQTRSFHEEDHARRSSWKDRFGSWSKARGKKHLPNLGDASQPDESSEGMGPVEREMRAQRAGRKKRGSWVPDFLHKRGSTEATFNDHRPLQQPIQRVASVSDAFLATPSQDQAESPTEIADAGAANTVDHPVHMRSSVESTVVHAGSLPSTSHSMGPSSKVLEDYAKYSQTLPRNFLHSSAYATAGLQGAHTPGSHLLHPSSSLVSYASSAAGPSSAQHPSTFIPRTCPNFSLPLPTEGQRRQVRFESMEDEEAKNARRRGGLFKTWDWGLRRFSTGGRDLVGTSGETTERVADVRGERVGSEPF